MDAVGQVMTVVMVLTVMVAVVKPGGIPVREPIVQGHGSVMV
jgi:hypothetical protein